MLTTSPLTAESIVAEAASRTGADPDSLRYRDGLARLARSLDAEGRLTLSGRTAVRGAMVASLVTQVRLDELCRRYPAVAATPVTRPVFVTGLLRTGTTLVHNLLAQHPDLRAPALWELMNPATERGDAGAHERLAGEAQRYVDEYNRLVPALKSIHFLDARRPDECHRLGGNAFESMVYEMRYRVPGYGQWLRDRDLTDAYLFHRRQLQAILWRLPGGPAVLKCPFHLWSLGALMRAYPDARVVHMHRNPTETIPSTCSLCAAIRGARSDRVDRREIGRYWLARVEGALAGLERGRAAVPTGQLLDVGYGELMADPLGTVGRVCDFAGVPLTAAAEASMRRYLDANPKTKHGAHRYEPAEFGLDRTDLDRRFADYRTGFGC